MVTCPECSTEFEHDGIDIGAGARVRYQPEFEAMSHDQFAAWMAALPEGPGWREGNADFPDQGRTAATAKVEAEGSEAEFPEGFTGPGPMFAAVPLGSAWLNVATDGATTYVLENPLPFGPEMTDEQANAAHQAYTGWSAFLDRAQAESLADHPSRHGSFGRWEGLTGYNDWSAKSDREFQAALEAGQ